MSRKNRTLRRKNTLAMQICHKLGFTKLPYQPYVLGVDPGNICNLHCPLCPTGLESKTIKRGMLDFELFKRVIDEIGAGLRELNLFNWGEPFLNKDILKMIAYARSKNQNVRITTSSNLNYLTEELAENLVRSGLDELIVSLDAATPHIYAIYRRGGDFNLVMKNLRKLIEAKKYFPESRLNIVLNFLVFKHNEHEIKDAQELAKSLGLNIRIGKMRTEMETEITQSVEQSIEKYKDWIPENKEYSAYDITLKKRIKEIKTCKKPWREAELNWDGTITPCCYIYDIENYSFGNINNSTFQEIWNNEKYVAARKAILGKKTEIKTICQICKRHGYTHM